MPFFIKIYTQQNWLMDNIHHHQMFLSERTWCNVHLLRAEETSCEGPLKETECVSSLKQVDDSKTPGTDGLPAEFY